MSHVWCFNELTCQLCSKSASLNKCFHVTDCTHLVCASCVEEFVLLKKCQIFGCGKEWISSKKEEVSESEFIDKINETQQIILFRHSKKMDSCFFHLNSISPNSPIFSTYKQIYAFHKEKKQFGFADIDYFRTSCGNIKDLYFAFKKRLEAENWMLVCEKQLETFLKTKMEQMVNLKITDFFANMDLYFVEDFVIFSRLLVKIESMLKTITGKKFIFNFYDESVRRIIDVISEFGNDFDESQEMLVKINPEVSNKNSLLRCSTEWPFSNANNRPELIAKEGISFLDFHQIQDARFLKKTKTKNQSKIRKLHRLETLFRFARSQELVKKGIPKSSILKARNSNLLLFMFPELKLFAHGLRHNFSDTKPDNRLDYCAVGPHIVIMRSGALIVGEYSNFDWKLENNYIGKIVTFTFSANQKKKYPIELKNDIYNSIGSFRDVWLKCSSLESKIENETSGLKSEKLGNQYLLRNGVKIGSVGGINDPDFSDFEIFRMDDFLVSEFEIYRIE